VDHKQDSPFKQPHTLIREFHLAAFHLYIFLLFFVVKMLKALIARFGHLGTILVLLRCVCTRDHT
jgi:hypothetical protein